MVGLWIQACRRILIHRKKKNVGSGKEGGEKGEKDPVHTNSGQKKRGCQRGGGQKENIPRTPNLSDPKDTYPIRKKRNL